VPSGSLFEPIGMKREMFAETEYFYDLTVFLGNGSVFFLAIFFFVFVGSRSSLAGGVGDELILSKQEVGLGCCWICVKEECVL
jgi:hypothetical protein